MHQPLRGIATERHQRLLLLVTLLFLGSVGRLAAGGGWVSAPGEGAIRLGYDWKHQPDAQRRDTKGELYRSLFNMTLEYKFLYLSGEVGIIKGLEASWLFTYLWASETVDNTSEDPSHYYDGLSDMWIGLKYQLWDGAFPTAISGTVRLPYLYEGSSTRNGHLLTEVPGLLKRDYDLGVSVSHSFDLGVYSTLSGGFRMKEGVATNQITVAAEAGGTLPVLDGAIFAKVGIDGAFAVGEPGLSTSKDRFSGLSLETGTHLFDFNDASYIRPGIGISVRLAPHIDLGVGYSYIVWGHSVVLYHDALVQLGYSF